jgi:hypothetical protein
MMQWKARICQDIPQGHLWILSLVLILMAAHFVLFPITVPPSKKGISTGMAETSLRTDSCSLLATKRETAIISSFHLYNFDHPLFFE